MKLVSIFYHCKHTILQKYIKSKNAADKIIHQITFAIKEHYFI